MIIEYTWSEEELKRKKCYKCKWLKLNDDDDFNGKCTVPEDRYNKRLVRYRSITDKCCSRKEYER